MIENLHGSLNQAKNYRILFFNTMWGFPLPFSENQIPPGFEVTMDRTQMNEVDVIVFHIPDLYKYKTSLPSNKPTHQIWIGWSLECEENYPVLKNLRFRSFFDLWIGYKPSDDIVYPYYADFNEKLIRNRQMLNGKQDEKKLVCMFISSNVNNSKRQEYLHELMRYVHIDSYGKLFNNVTIENDSGTESLLRIMSGYKFAIAFENAIANDYVTEKFFNPLYVGAIPIYLGAPNVEEFAPTKDCFVDVRKFESPKLLADYIVNYTNSNKLDSFHKWRLDKWSTSFCEKLLSIQTPFILRLCEKISNVLIDRRYD